MQELDHKHLVVTAAIALPPTTVQEIEQWLLTVVEAADMKVFMQPVAARCDAVGNEGVTGVVGLETSHASIHVWESAPVPFLKFDIYSCKRFDPHVIMECMKAFKPYYMQYMLIDRNDVHTVMEDAVIVLDDSVAPPTSKTLTPDRSSLVSIKEYTDAKGVPFDLTPQWFDEQFAIAQEKWPELVRTGSTDSFWVATIDQIEQGLGYFAANCRLIPNALSMARAKWTLDELENLADLLDEYLDEADEALPRT